MPDMMETRVDLPAPLRPTNPKQRPGRRDTLTSRKATVLPNCFEMETASTAGTGSSSIGTASELAPTTIIVLR